MLQNPHPHPLIVAVALSLYGYNVSVTERAQKLYDHFSGDCLDMQDLMSILLRSTAYAATELPMPTAAEYVRQALERYGEEAEERVRANMVGLEKLKGEAGERGWS